MLLSVSGNEDASEKLSSLGLNKVERVRGGSALPGCSAEVRVEGALGPADPGKQPPSPKLAPAPSPSHPSLLRPGSRPPSPRTA